MSEELPLCECGCGEPVAKEDNRFILGHNLKINNTGINHPMFGKKGIESPNYKEKIELICQWCNKSFYVKPHEKDRKFCSRRCSAKYYAINKCGKDNPRWSPKIILTCQYCNKEFEITQTLKGKKKFCSQECYSKWQAINKCGEDSPAWKGGIANEPYCFKFNTKLKQSIRDQYNNCDYISGLPQRYFKRKLDVHHIDYDKDQGCGKNFNLIPLCQANHIRTNFNRLFWEKLFIYSLEIDKWYYKDGVI